MFSVPVGVLLAALHLSSWPRRLCRNSGLSMELDRAGEVVLAPEGSTDLNTASEETSLVLPELPP